MRRASRARRRRSLSGTASYPVPIDQGPVPVHHVSDRHAARSARRRRASRGSTTRRRTRRIPPARCGTPSHAIDAVRNGPEWSTNISTPETNIFNDVTSGTAAGGFVGHSGSAALRPSQRPRQSGRRPVVGGAGRQCDRRELVLGLDRRSSSCGTTGAASTITCRRRFSIEAGGLGFRVPMIVVSPYVAAGTSRNAIRVRQHPQVRGETFNLARSARPTRARRRSATSSTSIRNRGHSKR